ncbi:MAG: NAD(P)/FAD-dependent oxidoreductase [Sandaracinaceae bacterium]
MISEATTDIVVIGAGPGGLAAAVEAARTGRRVMLVSEGPLGGRATHASLLPSKVLLHLAEQHRARKGRTLASPETVAHIVAEIEGTADHQAARARERLEDSGVHVVTGLARFEGPSSMEVEREGKPPLRLSFARAIVATGSVPWFPPGFFGDAPGPDGETIFAPRFVRRLRSLPEEMLVVGAGVTGAEAVHAFSALGVRVTWLIDDLGILPRFDRELASSLGDVLMERGVKIVHGKAVLSVTRDASQGALAKLDGGRTYAAPRAFVAVGRRPDVARLRPEAAGLAVDPRTGGLTVDPVGRTSTPTIYAVGDAAGAPFTATKARAEAWVAARHATDQAVEPPVRAAWIEAVYTAPEIARVGVTPEEAMRRGKPFEIRSASFESGLRGVLEGCGVDPHARGLLKVVLSDDETVEGAIAIGPRASDVLAPIATAIHLGVRAPALRGLFLASPTLPELALDALR